MPEEKYAALRKALEQQRTYERDNWPFDNAGEPPVMGESITNHLASLYCWPPEYVLTLSEQQRNERLREIWRSFALAGDIIKRYEEATMALLSEDESEKEN